MASVFTKKVFTSANSVRKELQSHADSRKARIYRGFSKTGKGDYAEFDKWIGVDVPTSRQIAARSVGLSDTEIIKLTKSSLHEERYLGFIIWTLQMTRAARELDVRRQKEIAHLYLRYRGGVNNWDLVDSTCHLILGTALGYDILPRLEKWAKSSRSTLWEKRIAMVTTYHFIRLGDSYPTLRLATLMIAERHELLQKAVGWMLREVGKACGQEVLENFLRRNCKKMGRTALRYAIERLGPNKQKIYSL